MTEQLKNKYRDKLEWLEMGIPLTESEHNPNGMVFTLAMPWKDVVNIIKELERERDLANGGLQFHQERADAAESDLIKLKAQIGKLMYNTPAYQTEPMLLRYLKQGESFMLVKDVLAALKDQDDD
jgi:hypothetical protein